MPKQCPICKRLNSVWSQTCDCGAELPMPAPTPPQNQSKTPRVDKECRDNHPHHASWPNVSASFDRQLETELIQAKEESKILESQLNRDINRHKEVIAGLAAQNEKLVSLVKAAKCPNCDGSGSYPIPLGEHFVSAEMAQDAGNPSMAGQSMGIEYGQEQCQWCFEKNEIINKFSPTNPKN